MILIWYAARTIVVIICLTGFIGGMLNLWHPWDPTMDMKTFHIMASMGNLIGTMGWMVAFFPGWLFTSNRIQERKNLSLARRKALDGVCYYKRPCPHQSYGRCRKHWEKELGVNHD